MENSVIAVQIANGTFVPVLNTSSKKRRRLVVTTVRDNQTNVKIELFRGSDESMSDPEYVGSLIIENIEPTESGDPDISVLLGVDGSGSLNATATDTRSGEYQSLSVGLDRLEQEGGYDMPDFQLNDEEDFDLATPSELDELSLDESSDEQAPLEELSLEDEDDFDLSSLDTDLGAESEPEPREPGPPEPGPREREHDSEASEEVFSFEDDLGDLSLDEPEELTPDEPTADEPALEELSLENEDDDEDEGDFDLSSLDLDAEPESDPEPLEPGTPEPTSPEPEPELLSELGDDDSLDELSLDEPEEFTPDDEDDFDLSSLESDLDTEPEPLEPSSPEPEPLESSSPEPEPLASEDTFSFDEEALSELGPDDGLGDLSFDDLDSFSDLDSFKDLDASEAPEPGDESEDLSLDELSTPNAEETAALTDIPEEDFSFDESFSFEAPGEEDESGDDLDDLDLGALTEEESDFGVDEGLVEADLGEEDFTFDEGIEDEPLFVEPEPRESTDEEAEFEDTLSPEEFDRLDSEPLSEVEPVADEAMQPRRSNAIIFVGYLVLALAALGIATYLVFRLMEGPPAPPLRAGLLRHLSSAWLLLGIPVVGRRRKG